MEMKELNPTGSRPVNVANVEVGIPIEPKVVGTELATRQAKIDFSGWNPRPTIIAAGIATAVPKPAMPSMNAPKPHAKRMDKIRISGLTEVNIVLMVSMAFVSTTRLYVKIAAVITNKIGQIANATPSNAPDAIIPASLPYGTTATIKEITTATKHAFHAGTFNTANATISHRIGNNARITSTTYSPFLSKPYTITEQQGCKSLLSYI